VGNKYAEYYLRTKENAVLQRVTASPSTIFEIKRIQGFNTSLLPTIIFGTKEMQIL
jgi:hypothetical protein